MYDSQRIECAGLHSWHKAQQDEGSGGKGPHSVRCWEHEGITKRRAGIRYIEAIWGVVGGLRRGAGAARGNG